MKKNLKNPEEKVRTDSINAENEAYGDEPILELLGSDFVRKGTSRRDFLKVLGFSFASAAVLASCRRPVQNALPYITQPPEVTPGKALYYASGYYDGHEYAGILVKTRDGRPIKIEGNALSSFNREGTTARVQASVLSLYDDARLKSPLAEGLPVTWDAQDSKIISALSEINSNNGEIVLLTSSIISPSSIRLINEFGSQFKKFRWVKYDAISYSAILEANDICFGKPVIPDYHFDKSSLVVSINADFLGTWVAPVHFIPGYASGRKLEDGRQKMLKHVHFESGMSLTGSNADIRKKIKPSEEKALLKNLYDLIAGNNSAEGSAISPYREDLSDLAMSLIASKGRSIVVSGTNDVEIQILVNGINELLGNYNECIDLDNHINIASGIDSKMDELVDDMNAGKVDAILMYNVNPAYDYPRQDKFLEGLKKTGLSVNMSVRLNETTGESKYECPVNHFLESWDDAEITPGQLSLSQPCINPIFNTRSLQDSLLKWSGRNMDYHDYLKENWHRSYFHFSDFSDFEKFWNKSLGNGVFNFKKTSDGYHTFRKEELFKILKTPVNPSGKEFEIILTESVSLGTGMHSNNPWLMELPDPVSRQCWDNVAAISRSDAEKLNIKTGSLIKITEGLILPVFIQPGQSEGTISAALGYGHTNSGHVSNLIGINLYPFVRLIKGNRLYYFEADKPVDTFEVADLAMSQEHYSMEGRPIVRETVMSEYRNNPSAGNEFHKEFENSSKTLYPEVKYDGYHWGVSIDLNSCVGCNACVIACQAENNIPVVGKDEVIRKRIMHWIKIDRYYSEDQENPKVYFQPVACQHCDNAPCENVCPVSATNHSSEGLNQMTYNRCVGTKYCINNCPYRARRFNWYRYTLNKAFDYNAASDLGRMVLNPDVTVRERGVVEKCSLCVQRIQEKKLQAKLENRTIADYEIKTACMQACPSQAIVFGNLNDKDSKVSQLYADPRRYNLLEELHTLPSIGYLTKVRNDEEINS